jgi:hypothetical protein
MDDLRDYRFYGKDLVHPSELAVDYIWEHFSGAFMESSALSIAEEVLKIRRAMGHRIQTRNRHQLNFFAEQQLDRIDELGEKAPFLSFADEIAHFRALLTSD